MYEVVGAIEVEAAVVIAIAGGGPAGYTVDFAVGYCDTIQGAGAEGHMLVADERNLLKRG